MRDIYSEAALVNAWLGPADPGDAATVGMMISILAQNRSHVLRDVFPENEQLQELGLPTRDSPAWKTLNSMLNAPYFSRVWIIQELALAATYTLLWGDIVISKADFMSFKRATMNLGMCHPDLRAMASSVGRKGSKGLYPHVKWNHVSMLFTEEFWNMGKDLFDLLSSTKHCYATDPRHKIFALIGLAGDKTFGIRPNYNKTKSVVFTEFALNVISETRNLKVLNYSDVEDPNDEERLPLWAPRWHHEATPGYCDMSLFGFKSSNGLEINLESSINTQVLQLNGLYVDQVKESYAQDIKPDLNCMAIGSMVTNQRRLLEHQYGLDMIRAIALTMIKGRTLPLYADTECKRPTDDSYLNAFTAFAFRSFVASFVKIDDGERYQKAILQLIKMAIDARPPMSQNDPDWDRPGLRKFVNDKLAHLHPDSMETVSSCMEVLGRMSCDIEDFLTFAQDFGYSCHRKFFITRKGYIGTGPRSLEPGDFVCILFGGDTPYIVRQRPSASDEYLFLGTTYVHGIMEGEAITTWQEQKDSQDPKFQERLFKLI